MSPTGMVFDMKRTAALICLAVLLLLLPACGNDQPPVVTTNETTTATQPETTAQPEITTAPLSTWPFAPIPDKEPPDQSHEPLRQGEMVIERASINDIVERFGVYESYSTSRSEGYGAWVQLEYPNLIVEISGAFSFDQDDDSWGFGNKDTLLTEADKATVGFVSHLFWNDSNINLIGPRGLKIGDSEKKVLRCYLDLRAERQNDPENGSWQDDTRMIYRQDDSTEKPYAGFNGNGYYRLYADEEYPPPVPCDYSIVYACSDMSYMLEGTEFYIKDSKVVAIRQWYHEGC